MSREQTPIQLHRLKLKIYRDCAHVDRPPRPVVKATATADRRGKRFECLCTHGSEQLAQVGETLNLKERSFTTITARLPLPPPAAPQPRCRTIGRSQKSLTVTQLLFISPVHRLYLLQFVLCTVPSDACALIWNVLFVFPAH